jgi:endoglucanase
LVGEWGLTGKSVESGAAWRYFDFFVRTTVKYKLATQLWDNGGDHYDRINKKWRDPVKLEIIKTAVKGVPNTMFRFPQIATIWVKKGSTPGAFEKEVLLDFNGNTLRSIVNAQGSTLKQGTDYQLSANGFNLTDAYFQKAIKNSDIGLKDTLTIKSSQGIQLPLEVRVYDRPTFSQTVINTSSTDSLSIPVGFNGATLATVQAIRKDGVILKDCTFNFLSILLQ